jgi:hypothetical protein
MLKLLWVRKKKIRLRRWKQVSNPQAYISISGAYLILQTPTGTTSWIRNTRNAAVAIFLDERVISLAVMMVLIVFCVEVSILSLHGLDNLRQQPGLFAVNILLFVWVALHAIVGLCHTWD